jgi:hypothetical protein
VWRTPIPNLSLFDRKVGQGLIIFKYSLRTAWSEVNAGAAGQKQQAGWMFIQTRLLVVEVISVTVESASSQFDAVSAQVTGI